MSTSTHDERWRELCAAIVDEPNSQRLMELVNKLNRILEERESLLNRRSERNGE